MRLLLAMMKHETNTFSPVPTPLQRFRDWGMHEDRAVVTAYRGTNHPLAAYIDLAAEIGAEIVTPIAAEGMPSGPVSREAYDYLTGRILDALATQGPFDAALLDLHGAMVPDGMTGGEGPLLKRMREIAPGLPIAATFDMHGNMTDEIMANATVVVGYKTYPHVDMYKAGEQCGRIMLRALKGEVTPVIRFGQAGILAQTLRMGSDEEPMQGAIAACLAEEARAGILAASIFGGFPMADIPDAGLSMVVVADAGTGGGHDIGQAACDRLLAYAQATRTDWFHVHHPLDAAVARAKTIADGPVVLLDHADNVGSGGTSDVMTVIAEVLRQGLEGVAMAAVWDPAAVQMMQKAGVGATITLELGGRTAMPSIGLAAKPLTLTGKVRRLSDGEWTVRGPMYTGSRVTAGPTAVFETGGMQIVVTSLHHEPWDAGIFTHIGIDPAHCRYILLKSRVHYRAGFRPFEKHRITLDGDGVTTSDNTRLSYSHLKPGTYPFN
jgi:microcystin degradation protein MlrC